jgi:D,D-heptose 1,7-bisphosphate phosphatase
MNRAVFIDKDGTLVEDLPYNVDPARARFTTGAVAGLAALQAAGFELVLVSNQSGVARGYFDLAAVESLFEHLRRRLAASGVQLRGSYYCPHHVDGCVPEYAFACDCRKPASGLLRRAAREHDLDLGASYMIGDILDDVEAGRRAGCRTVLLLGRGETEWRLTPHRTPDYIANDLTHAAQVILRASRPPAAASRRALRRPV